VDIIVDIFLEIASNLGDPFFLVILFLNLKRKTTDEVVEKE